MLKGVWNEEAHKGVLTNALQGHVCWPWHACVALITGNAWFCLPACWLSEPIITFPFATHPSKQASICSLHTLNHKHQIGHKVYQLSAIPLVIVTSISLPISALCPLRVYSPQQKIPLKESRHFFLSNTTLKKCKSLSEDYMIQLKYSRMERKESWKKSKWHVYADSLHTELSKMLLGKVQLVPLNVTEPYKEVQLDVTWCLLTELFFLMRQNMLLRIRAHIIRSFCSCKCMWRWCKTTGRRMHRESGKNEKFHEQDLLIE